MENLLGESTCCRWEEIEIVTENCKKDVKELEMDETMEIDPKEESFEKNFRRNWARKL